MTEGDELPNPRINQIAQRKGNQQILRNIGRLAHQTSGNKRKNLKGVAEEQENYSRPNSIVGTLSKG